MQGSYLHYGLFLLGVQTGDQFREFKAPFDMQLVADRRQLCQYHNLPDRHRHRRRSLMLTWTVSNLLEPQPYPQNGGKLILSAPNTPPSPKEPSLQITHYFRWRRSRRR